MKRVKQIEFYNESWYVFGLFIHASQNMHWFSFKKTKNATLSDCVYVLSNYWQKLQRNAKKQTSKCKFPIHVFNNVLKSTNKVCWHVEKNNLQKYTSYHQFIKIYTVSEDEYDTPSNKQYWNEVTLTRQNLT